MSLLNDVYKKQYLKNNGLDEDSTNKRKREAMADINADLQRANKPVKRRYSELYSQWKYQHNDWKKTKKNHLKLEQWRLENGHAPLPPFANTHPEPEEPLMNQIQWEYPAVFSVGMLIAIRDNIC